MKISWIRIEGFRNFVDETIHLNSKTLIIGANDIGKTNMLYALRILLDKSLSVRDLELTDSDYNAYTDTDEISITICIEDIVEDCLKSVFAGSIQDDTTYIKYSKKKNDEFKVYTGISIDLLEEHNSRYYLKRINLEYVNTNRDLNRFIKKERSNILKVSQSLLKEKDETSDKESILKIKEDLSKLNSNIDKLNYIKNSLVKVNSELSSLAIHNEDQNIKFVASNGDVNDFLDNIDLAYVDGERMLKIGGDGRNNQIFIALWVAKQKIEETRERVTIFAIEEPEAHLHPHQQRKLSKYLIESFSSQVLITTHSPQIASEFKPNSIVRLFSRAKTTYAAMKGCCNELKITFDDFGYRLNALTSEIFFSSAVFLVEGPSEVLFYTALAKTMNIDLDRLNISLISVNGVGFKPYIKICKALDIPYVLRTDDDVFSKKKGGSKYYYFAGISRCMGIYKELIMKEKGSDELMKYWKQNKHHNEWSGEPDDYGDETIDFNNEISDKLQKHNLFLSIDNLEEDLVNSELVDALCDYYDVEDKEDTESLLELMQKRKAENMLSFLSDNMKKLEVLAGNDIVIPLTTIEKIAVEVVSKNDETQA